MPKDEYLYGIHPVREALKARRRQVRHLYLVKKKSLDQRHALLMAEAERRRIPVTLLAPSDLTKRCDNPQHQGVVASVSAFPLTEAEAFLEENPASASPLILALDSLEDPHNLGALLRSALCAGVTGVITPKNRSAGPTPTVSKVSAGALEHTRLVRVTNLSRTLQQLKARGFWIAGADCDGKVTLYETDLTAPFAIVIGGESNGLRPLVKKNCDILVRIPQEGPLNSLNASVAGSVMLYEAFRQRHLPKHPKSESLL